MVLKSPKPRCTWCSTFKPKLWMLTRSVHSANCAGKLHAAVNGDDNEMTFSPLEPPLRLYKGALGHNVVEVKICVKGSKLPRN